VSAVRIDNLRAILMIAVCASMLSVSWIGFLENNPDRDFRNDPIELQLPAPRMETNVGNVISFNTTWTVANSPYYLNSAVAIQQGVRLTIQAGVNVYANTTNATLIVHGELHSLGDSSNPVFIGVNPSASWTQSSGYWNGIKGASPSQGNEPLLMRNTTVSGPTNYWYTPGQSWTGNSNLFHFEHFFRNNGDFVVDNVTMRDAREVFIKPFNSNFNNLTVTNLLFDNISMIRAEGQSFYRACGGDWKDDVTVRRSSVNFEYPTYMSTTSSYCNANRPAFDNWTYEQSDVRLYTPGSWTTATTSNPAWFSGRFTDSTLDLASSSNWNGPLLLKHSTFNTTGSPTTTAWSYSQYASQRTDAFIRAGTSSYGKWVVENNSFEPANGWTVIDYTYQNNRMSAQYNWWGSSNRTVIDGLIEDINDNNGGNWVNYCPMYDTPAMSTLSTDCTRIRVDFTSPLNGTSQVGYNITVNYTHLMVSIGDWYLDGNWIGAFNISDNSLNLTGLSMGWRSLCAIVSGVGNQQGTFCLQFQMTPFFPLVNITSPASGGTVPTTQSTLVIQYTVSNVSSGIWRLNGQNIGAVNINVTSVQITGLAYGNNSICLIGYGLSSLVDTDCISLWRNFPPVSVIISDPLDGSSIFGRTLTVVYSHANVTDATWYLDGYDFGQVLLNRTSRTFPALAWGAHLVCISPVGLDGAHPNVCANVTLVAPPLELEITSPANRSSVHGDSVTIDYNVSNATSGNWTLNGNAVMGVTLWSQQAVILSLLPGDNIICIDTEGLDSQALSVCITIVGQTLDSDGDGVADHSDSCPNSPAGTVVASDGCTDPTSDLDSDGVPDLSDLCPDTLGTEVADSNGCGPSQRDSDEDGVSDADDGCSGTSPGASVDAFGCADDQLDSDGDGVTDDLDIFPLDATQSSDRDGDGYGDNLSGNDPDEFPDESTQWSDLDGDGWGDNPLGTAPDACPIIAGVLEGELGVGCPLADDPPVDNGTGNQTGGNETGNQTGGNGTDNQTLEEEPPQCPICGLNLISAGYSNVNDTSQFEARDRYMLGANYWTSHTFTWDFGDGNTSTGSTVSHTYTYRPDGGRYLITLCVEFEEGPTVCMSEFIVITEGYVPPNLDDNQSGDGTNQETSGGSGSYMVAGFAAFVAFLLGSLIAATFLLTRSKGEEEDSSHDLAAPIDEEVPTQPPHVGSESSPTATSDPPQQVEEKGASQASPEVSVDESGYEWSENPPGSGDWYYREPGISDWQLWEE